MTQPKPGDYAFDLDEALSAVVQISSIVPETAFSAATLGTERAGNAVCIGADGLFLTIGYLVSEAEQIWLRTGDRRVAQADVLGVDQTSGFALVQALGDLGAPALPIGDSDAARVGDRVVVAGGGGRRRAVAATIATRQPFAGYWEYFIEEAIFTTPSHPNWGGAAAIDATGDLIGLGSLQLERPRGKDETENINMCVPINLLKPAMDDLRATGRIRQPARPWLGLYATEMDEKIVVMGIADHGPSKRADLRTGDVLVAVGGAGFNDLGSFYQRVWALGQPGVVAPLTVLRDGRTFDIEIRTGDRNRTANPPKLH